MMPGIPTETECLIPSTRMEMARQIFALSGPESPAGDPIWDDFNGDGKIDAWDTNGDGTIDAYDSDGDGIPDKFWADAEQAVKALGNNTGVQASQQKKSIFKMITDNIGNFIMLLAILAAGAAAAVGYVAVQTLKDKGSATDQSTVP